MGETSRFELPYPEVGDETNVPLDLQELADATDSRLSRRFTCTSSTRPAGVPTGFEIYETDTGLSLLYDGASWIGPGTGGGGGGSSTGGRFTAGSTAQSIPNTASGPGTVCAFGTASSSPVPTGVTRTTEGAGHKFELLSSGVWACGASVRVASSATGGEVSASIWADLNGDGSGFDYNVAPDGGRREGLPRTLQPSRSTYLPAGCKLVVYVFNGTGSTRTLEPNAGSWVNIDLWLVG
jgi:hypothetical protein